MSKSRNQPMNSDVIAALSDEDLSRRLNAIKRVIETKIRQKSSATGAEEEYCYLQREAQIRDARKAAHQEYMSSRPRRRRSY